MTYSLARPIPANIRIREVARPGSVEEVVEEWRRRPRSIVGKMLLVSETRNMKAVFQIVKGVSQFLYKKMLWF